MTALRSLDGLKGIRSRLVLEAAGRMHEALHETGKQARAKPAAAAPLRARPANGFFATLLSLICALTTPHPS